jgi:hypothetical protein
MKNIRHVPVLRPKSLLERHEWVEGVLRVEPFYKELQALNDTLPLGSAEDFAFESKRHFRSLFDLMIKIIVMSYHLSRN